MNAQRGLTLLELMVVVFILSALALSAVSLVGRTDHQVRYDRTCASLEAMRRAIAGDPATGALSGFVADLGVLPSCVEDLFAAPDGAEAFGARAPSVGGVSLPPLPKGWRGPYLALPAGAALHRDGWGNVSRDGSGGFDATADEKNHGWVFSASGGGLSIASLGADGAPGDSGTSPFDADLPLDLAPGDWRADVDGWAVEVHNATAASLTATVALFVYRYDATDGAKWERYDSETKSIPAGTAETLSFGADASRVVPLGRHLLAVVEGTSVRASRQVAFAARALPDVRFRVQ